MFYFCSSRMNFSLEQWTVCLVNHTVAENETDLLARLVRKVWMTHGKCNSV